MSRGIRSLTERIPRFNFIPAGNELSGQACQIIYFAVNRLTAIFQCAML